MARSRPVDSKSSVKLVTVKTMTHAITNEMKSYEILRKSTGPHNSLLHSCYGNREDADKLNWAGCAYLYGDRRVSFGGNTYGTLDGDGLQAKAR